MSSHEQKVSTSMRRLILSTALAVALTATGTAGASAAKTLCVGGGGCYPTLQAALTAAHDGDTILLHPGSYAGGVTVNVNVAIQGGGADRTIIKGGGPVLTIGTFLAASEPTVSIRGVTITDGSNTSSPDATVSQGGGIWIPVAANQAAGATVAVTDSVVTGNTVASTQTIPGGPFCGGPLVCGFDDGGGIDNGGNLTLTGTQVTNNLVGGASAASSDDFGGGIMNRGSASLTLTRSVVSGNRVLAQAPNGRGADAGGIANFGALTIADSFVTGNSAELDDVFPGGIDDGAFAGGIDLDGSATATISNTSIANNRVDASDAVGDEYAYAGGILVGSGLQLSNSWVLGNRVTVSAAGSAFDDGGGLEVDGAATIVKTMIAGNSVSGTAAAGSQSVSQGGGLANVGQTTLQGVIVSANTVAANGSGGLAQGGGIWNSVFNEGDAQPQLTLIDTAVFGNHLVASPGVTVQGGGLFTSAPIVRTRSVIFGNTPNDCSGC